MPVENEATGNGQAGYGSGPTWAGGGNSPVYIDPDQNGPSYPAPNQFQAQFNYGKASSAGPGTNAAGGAPPNPNANYTASGYDPDSIFKGPDGHYHATRRTITADPNNPGRTVYGYETADLGDGSDLGAMASTMGLDQSALSAKMQQADVNAGNLGAQAVKLGQYNVQGIDKDANGNTVWRLVRGDGQKFSVPEDRLKDLDIQQSDIDQAKANWANAQASMTRLGNFSVVGKNDDGSLQVMKGDGTTATVSRDDIAAGKVPGVAVSDFDNATAQWENTQATLGKSKEWTITGTDAQGNVLVRDFHGNTETMQPGKSYPGISNSDIQQAQQKGNELAFWGSNVPTDMNALMNYGQGGFFQQRGAPTGPGTSPGVPAPMPPGSGGGVSPGQLPPSRSVMPQAGPGAMPSAMPSGNPWGGGIPAYQPQPAGGPGSMMAGTQGGVTGGPSKMGSMTPSIGMPSGGDTSSAGGGPQRAIPGFGAARPTYAGMKQEGMTNTTMAGNTSMGSGQGGYPTRGQTFSGVNFNGTQQDLSLGNTGMNNIYQRNQLLFNLANQGRTQALQSNQDAVQYGQAVRAGQGRSFTGMGPLRGSTIVGQ